MIKDVLNCQFKHKNKIIVLYGTINNLARYATK